MRIPPGVNEADFRAALNEFGNVVGNEWVLTSDEDVATYRDTYSPWKGEEQELVASAAVAPDTAEQVQEVMKIAHRYGIPMYPVSTGKNLGYGGAAPVHSGSVVLDLKRMNRILEFDETAGTVLVEPGVSYFDLFQYIMERNLPFWVDTPDPGWGSLIGNAIDGGMGGTYGMLRHHFEAHCGMEVVLADGEVLRTAMGAMPGAKTWQQFRWGYGPYLDGLFKQSNYGVVTKMGFWLGPKPEAFRRGTVFVPRFADLGPLIEVRNYLEDTMATNGMPEIGSPLLGGGDFSDPTSAAMYIRTDANIPELEREAASKGGFWSCRFAYYGNAGVIQAQWEHTKAMVKARIPDARFEDNEVFDLPATPEQMAQFKTHPTILGIPNLLAFQIGGRSAIYPNPTSGHMWFSPVIPRTGDAIIEANRVLVDAVADFNVPLLWFSPPVTIWPRGQMLVIGVPISADPEENQRMRKAFRNLIAVAAEHGWGEYRTPPIYQDFVQSTYSFNDHIQLRVSEALKDALDPKGILSAGRYGIWPKHLRDKS